MIDRSPTRDEAPSIKDTDHGTYVVAGTAGFSRPANAPSRLPPIPGRIRISIARLIASGFGLGRVPVAAGTVASLAATLAGGGLLMVASPAWLAGAALAAAAVGYSAVISARIEGDPGWVTIDELAGQFIVLLAIPDVTVGWLLSAFLIFRILDITKLGPVGWADRKHGAFGIMADDVIAGMIGAVILLAFRWATHLL